MKRMVWILLALLLCVSAMGSGNPRQALVERDRELPELNGMSVTTVDMVAVGDVLTMGEFEQDNDFTNGSEPLAWRVLKKSGHRVMLITEKIITARPFNETYKKLRWRACDLRTWLNGEFMEKAFTAAEQKLIQEVELVDSGNEDYGIGAGSETRDRVFLLDMDEAFSCFSSAADRAAVSTKYADAQGFSKNADGWWWLRNAGQDLDHAALIYKDGSVYRAGDSVSRTYIGVRPAMWIELP